MTTQDQAPNPAVERRQRESDSILLHIQEMQTAIKEIKNSITYHHGIFEERVEKAVVKVYVSAFPDGDPDGHRKHHELVIKREEEKVAFWQEMRVAGAKWAGMGVLSFLALAAWNAFLQGPHK
jgi:hypothetical protein